MTVEKLDEIWQQPAAGTRRFWVTREVIEAIEVEAVDEETAVTIASETPIDGWIRDIKVEEIIG